MISDIMHSFALNEGIPAEKRGRKSIDLREISKAAGLPSEYGLIVLDFATCRTPMRSIEARLGRTK